MVHTKRGGRSNLIQLYWLNIASLNIPSLRRDLTGSWSKPHLLIKSLHSDSFLFQIHSLSFQKFIEIDLVSVEIRTIHAGKLSFPSHCNAAGAAHSSAIHHYRIQADHGFDLVKLGYFADGPHHYHRTDCHDEVDRGWLFRQQFSQKIGNEAMMAVGSVIRGNQKLMMDVTLFPFCFRALAMK